MLDSVIVSRQRYMADLEEKRKLREKEAVKKKELTYNDDKDKTNEELQQIKGALLQIKNGFSIADESVSEGNKELKDLF
jgi:hypothetical protein